MGSGLNEGILRRFLVSSLSVDWVPPEKEQIDNGRKYCLCVDNTPETRGAILDESGTLLWRYEPRPLRSVYSPLNLLGKPELVFINREEQEVLKISRNRRLPPSFELLDGDQSVGRIVLQTPLRNRYRVEFQTGTTWLIKMRLFSTYFPGKALTGKRVWIMVGPCKRQWNLLLDPEADHLHLLAALAFIHREWWCYS